MNAENVAVVHTHTHTHGNLNKTGFSKNHTNIIKGIAILMLIGYHCFSSVSRFNGYEVNFGLIAQKTAIYIFESMNICVRNI